MCAPMRVSGVYATHSSRRDEGIPRICCQQKKGSRGESGDAPCSWSISHARALVAASLRAHNSFALAARQRQSCRIMNLSQCVWTADWTINDVELPHDLPAPVCSPHELCRAAAKAIKKHAKHKLGSDQVLLHWPLADGGLFVYGGDNIRLVVKASYRMNAAEVETGVISSSSRDKKKAEAGRERREGELRRLGAVRNTLRFFTRER